MCNVLETILEENLHVEPLSSSSSSSSRMRLRDPHRMVDVFLLVLAAAVLCSWRSLNGPGANIHMNEIARYDGTLTMMRGEREKRFPSTFVVLPLLFGVLPCDAELARN